MSKLVRDGVPDFLQKAGAHIEFTEALPDMREPLVFSKLLEEAGEWLSSRTRDERLKELGDLMEVIWALGEIDGIGSTEILQQAHGKHRARGGFENLAVMSVELGDDPAARVRGASKAHFATASERPVGDGPWYSG